MALLLLAVRMGAAGSFPAGCCHLIVIRFLQQLKKTLYFHSAFALHLSAAGCEEQEVRTAPV